MKAVITKHCLARTSAEPCGDACLTRLQDDAAIAALADALGSSRAGRAAAETAVAQILDYYAARPRAWSPARALEEFTVQISRRLFQESAQLYQRPEMLCTLAVVVIEGDALYGLNVGDSAVFVSRGGRLVRLSEPHILDGADQSHVLTRALGLAAEVRPHAFTWAVESGDAILLCSDGVTGVLDETRLGELLAIPASARSIASEARARATPETLDDISAVVIEIVERGPSRAADGARLDVAGPLRAAEPIGDYRLDRPLDDDRRVWLAARADGVRHVLKFPRLEARDDERWRERFLRELWNARRMRDACLVEAFVPPGPVVTCYAMAWHDAPSLADVLKGGRLAVEEVIALGRFLAAAGQFFLRHDAAHGDVKPGNILVLRRGVEPIFKLVDFGSAAPLFSVADRAGTPSYLAPERFAGAPLSERTEIFAMGVTLFQAATGTYPYGEIERFQTPHFAAPRSLAKLNAAVPPWLDGVVHRALLADPERRYQHYSELAYDLAHPDKVEPWPAREPGLIDRDPLLFFKILCVILALLNILQLLLRWFR